MYSTPLYIQYSASIAESITQENYQSDSNWELALITIDETGFVSEFAVYPSNQQKNIITLSQFMVMRCFKAESNQLYLLIAHDDRLYEVYSHEEDQPLEIKPLNATNTTAEISPAIQTAIASCITNDEHESLQFCKSNVIPEAQASATSVLNYAAIDSYITTDEYKSLQFHGRNAIQQAQASAINFLNYEVIEKLNCCSLNTLSNLSLHEQQKLKNYVQDYCISLDGLCKLLQQSSTPSNMEHMLELIEPQISTYVNTFDHAINLLCAAPYTLSTYSQLICKKLEHKIPTLASECEHPGTALKRLSNLKSRTIIKNLRGHIADMITNSQRLGNILLNLDGKHLQELLKDSSLDAYWLTIIPNSTELAALLLLATEDKCILLLSILGSQRLRKLIPNQAALRTMPALLDQTRYPLLMYACGYPTDNVEDNTLTFLKLDSTYPAILDARSLSYAHDLNPSSFKDLLSLLSNQLPNLIMQPNDLSVFLQQKDDATCQLFITSIQAFFPRLLTTGTALFSALKHLNHRQCRLIINAAKPELLGLCIGDPIEFIYELPYLNPLAYQPLFRVLAEKISEILPTIEVFIKSFSIIKSWGGKEQRAFYLKSIQPFVPTLINSREKLELVLNALDKKHAKIILIAMSGHLPALTSLGYDGPHKQLVLEAAASVTHRNGLFSTRASETRVGSLESQLTQYINTRAQESSYHWGFLGGMSATNWLSGGVTVHAKETKIAAAMYALDAYKSNEACLVRLIQMADMPSESTLLGSCTNSYLLVGPTNTPNQQLYYVDYVGHQTIINITHAEAIQPCFNKDSHLTYYEANQKLSQHTQGILPTQAQLEALKTGLLGDIMREANKRYILAGISPVEERAGLYLTA
ncbi:MAG: hypothetical protein P1U36_05405 [Legionellaceae bacterium]|nr:hypothetical protein [Legionellaceae bacterium]